MARAGYTIDLKARVDNGNVGRDLLPDVSPSAHGSLSVGESDLVVFTIGCVAGEDESPSQSNGFEDVLWE